MTEFVPQETRLFPKNRGANAYALTGLAARCDMVVFSDLAAPKIHVHRRSGCDHPRHIFLSLRAPFIALRFFVEEVLPALGEDFVLVSGSEDITLPRQTDHRWRRFDDAEQAMMDRILSHPRLVHWYAENLDRAGHPKRSPLPLGLVFPSGSPDSVAVPQVSRLADRPLRAFCAHRIREGAQWEPRRTVSRLLEGPWRRFCTTPEGELREAEFMRAVSEHAFVICVEGGGLDPAPKAWSALLYGAIPIIRRSALTAAYEHLPVAIVEDWSENELTEARLRSWRTQLGPAFDTPQGRRTTLFRLSLDYWWQFIEAGVPIRAPT